MYAIVETGSKQYKVSKGDLIEVEKIPSKEKKELNLDKVLFVSDSKKVSIGRPYVKGAAVVCSIVGFKRGKKTVSFKYRRRHANSKKKIGHRQDYTVLKVKQIAV